MATKDLEAAYYIDRQRRVINRVVSIGKKERKKLLFSFLIIKGKVGRSRENYYERVVVCVSV